VQKLAKNGDIQCRHRVLNEHTQIDFADTANRIHIRRAYRMKMLALCTFDIKRRA
jgi:hypothetical protein